MKNSTIARLLILLVCLYVGANSQCVRFYADYNHQGQSFQQCSSGNLPANWNDRVSSFVVPNGYTVQLYTDGGYAGKRYGPYNAGSYNVPAEFNDQLSSVRISKAQTPTHKCPTFYADYNHQGSSFQQCSSGNVAANWNDRVSSFVVPAGYTVQLYANNGYSGKSYGPYKAGSYNVPADFNDQLSSVKISQVQSQPQVKCPTFYDQKGLAGDSFQQCSSGNVPNKWDNKATSFVVPAGFAVYLYESANYQGKALGPYTQGTYDIPSSFNNRLSSIKIAKPQSQPQPPLRKCPTFYKKANQQGASIQLCSTDNMPAGWNDQVASFYVPPGFYVRLFEDTNSRGDCEGLYGAGSYNVPSKLKNDVSSVYIRRR